MIRRIKLLRNVGVFDSATAPGELKRVVLVFAENASGKTTLAEILRSLETGDPSKITKKQRFGTERKPHVVLECDDLSVVMFKDDNWTSKMPLVKVFDEAFVADNVYSGLNVEPGHRQNLHDFVLGQSGVTLSRARKKLALGIEQHNKDMKLVSDEVYNQQKALGIEQHNKDMKSAKYDVPDERRDGRFMDRFCDLVEVPDIDAKIRDARTALEAAQDADVLEAPAFEKVSLPAFDESAISAILRRGLQDLDAEAAAGVSRHVASLGDEGESWVDEGVKYMRGGACPFCGQTTAGASLIKHYRAYFGEAYKNLKRDIADMLDSIRGTHSSNTQTAFERTVGNNKSAGSVWARHGLRAPDIDTKPIMDDWVCALSGVERLLESKQAAPLEPVVWDSGILAPYESRRRQVADLNSKLDKYNDKILRIKSSNPADVQTARDRLQLLCSTKERYSPSIVDLCDRYIRARKDKKEAEEKKKHVTKQLEEYRSRTFPSLQADVNRYLEHFGVRYDIQDLKPRNVGKGSTCNYKVRVEGMPVNALERKSEDRPTIGSTLSTSDRNTLALALFFSSLEKDERLADMTVVVDDPVSSFDDNRSLATARVLQRLAEKAGQVIILSHKSEFLHKAWKSVGLNDCSAITMVRSDKGSTIRDWNVDQKPNAEQARRQRVLEAYVERREGDPGAVAATIRPYLEAGLEATCANHYDGNKQLRSFVKECGGKCGTKDEILNKATVDKLLEIVEYANPFMHGSKQSVDGGSINGEELCTYAQMALNIMKPSASELD